MPMSGDAAPTVLVTAGVQQAILMTLSERYTLVGPLAVPLERSVAQLTPERVARVRVLVTLGSSETSRAAMAALSHLGLVACTGAGYEGIDLAAARALGVHVTHSPGVTASSVADIAVGLLIASVRKLFDANTKLREQGLIKPWPTTLGLTGRRIGIYGLGAIGQQLARRLVGFEMEIGYHGRRARPELPYRHFQSVLSLAEWADVLAVCVPASAETAASIDQAVLAALGPQGHLINVSRGSVVDTAALCTALEAHGIAGAGLDVFDPAYLTRLLALPNATLTPHIGGATRQAEAGMGELVARNVAAFFAGTELVTPIPESITA